MNLHDEIIRDPPVCVRQELEARQAQNTGALATARSSAASVAQKHEVAAKQAEGRYSAAQAEVQSLKQQVCTRANSELMHQSHGTGHDLAWPYAQATASRHC